MTNLQIDIIPLLLQTIGAVLALLAVIIGWIGNRIHNRLDEIGQSLASIEKDLRDDLTSLDRRVTTIETKCAINHESH